MLYNKTLINHDRLVITGKYQTSVFYVQTSPYRLGPYCQDLDLIQYPVLSRPRPDTST